MKEHGESKELAALEARLLALPQPTVPPDLERKLLDAIPKRVGSPALGRALLWKRIVPATAAAAAIIVAAILLREAPVTSRQIPTANMRATSPRYVLVQKAIQDSQETRSCNILPPLPM